MATLQIYVDDATKALVEQAATEEDRSMSYLVKRWVVEALQRRKQVKLQSKTTQTTQ